MIKEIYHAHLGPIWYHSEPSDVPYYLNQFYGWDFFVAFYSKKALVEQIQNIIVYYIFGACRQKIQILRITYEYR